MDESKKQEDKIRLESGQCNSPSVPLKISFLSKGHFNSVFFPNS